MSRRKNRRYKQVNQRRTLTVEQLDQRMLLDASGLVLDLNGPSEEGSDFDVKFGVGGDAESVVDGGLSIVQPADTRVGSAFQISTHTTGDQTIDRFSKTLGFDGNGNAVAVWQSWAQDGNHYGVYGQRLDSTGAKIGSEFQINTTTASAQWYPEVVVAPTGEFVVVWSSHTPSAIGHDIHGQLFDAGGNAVGSEFLVNTTNNGEQQQASVAFIGGGDFVVVWANVSQHPLGVYGQRFDSTANPIGGQFQVSADTQSGSQPTVAADSAGNFTVVWQSWGEDGSQQGIVGQRFDSQGQKLGGEFIANTTTDKDQKYPSIAMDPQGNALVFWHSIINQDYFGDSEWEIRGQRYDASGNQVGDEILVTHVVSSSYDSYPAVSMDPSGGYVVAWNSSEDPIDSGQSEDVYIQKFDASDNKIGSAIRVNTTTAYRYSSPSIAHAPSGDFWVVWDSPDADNYGVFGQRFAGSSSNSSTGFTLNVDFGPTAGSPGSTGTVGTLESEDGFVLQDQFSKTHLTVDGDLTVAITGADGLFQRGGASDAGEFTYADLYNDFVYNNSAPTDTTFNFSGAAIQPNTEYDITFWAWDFAEDGVPNRTTTLTGVSGTTGSATIDWTAAQSPATNGEFTNTTRYKSDSQGVIQIVATDNAHLRINGLSIQSIAEPDGPASATVAISNLQDGADEILTADTSGTNLTQSFQNGVLTISGSGYVEDYEAALRTVAYQNTSTRPTLTPREVTFIVSDDGGDSPASMSTVSLF